MTDFLTHDDYMREKLEDLEYARMYLEVSLEEAEKDGDYDSFLLAVRRVIEVHGISRIARESSVSRRALYKAFSEEGNPRLDTLASVLHVLGLRLSIVSNEQLSASRTETADEVS